MRQRTAGRRRGFSVLIVLLLIAVTLSLSYASMRTQSVNHRIQRNAVFTVSAREAAASGLAAAIKAMHTTAWQGVGTTLVGRLSPHENFTVEFILGDEDLVAADADYQQKPYRVTLKATGHAADPINPTVIATHRAQAVVELIPRALSTPVAGLNQLTEHTVFQWATGTCSLSVPFRIEGPVRFRNRVRLDEDLKWTNDQQWWYYYGLNEMRKAGNPDWRPFTGPVYFRFDEQDSQAYALINTALQAQTVHTTSASTFAWQSNDAAVSYQLFPGGKVYAVETVAANLTNREVTSDVESNPAGLFARSGTVQIRNGTTIRGTLFTRGDGSSDITIQGDGINLEPISLPSLDGTADPVQLPVLVSADDITFGTGTKASVRGLIVARSGVEIGTSQQNQMSVAIEGRIACRSLAIGYRTPWNRAVAWWNLVWNLFWIQKSEGVPWFPAFVQYSDLNANPQITIAPDARPVRYHYYNLSQPIFVPHAQDRGLRWNVVRWTVTP
ncbi:MAG: hypothetical protein U1E05_26575 [Patescibacteria group bacterium]|nr:hypothetical protein [Patescibacteria group bacterium]